MTMYNPPHPGEVLKELYMEPLGLTITKTATALGVSRNNLSAIIHGHVGISTDMALRLAQCFNTTPDSWLNMQMQYNLWHTRHSKKVGKVKVLYGHFTQDNSKAVEVW